MNFSESRRVALWWASEEAPDTTDGIRRPDSGSSAGAVMVCYVSLIDKGISCVVLSSRVDQHLFRH